MSTILVVDDRPVSRQLLTTLLGYYQHHLIEAGDGKEALNMARQHRPDLIIADILMPTMDGFELVRQLRLDPLTALTPVIFYTASYLEKEARQLGESCGVSHFIIKPSEPETILQTVSSALRESVPPVIPLSVEEFSESRLQLMAGKLNEVVPRLVALIEVGQQLIGGRDPQRLVEDFCHAAREVIGAKYAAVGLLGDDGRTFSGFITSGISPEEIIRIGQHPTGRGVLERAIAADKPFRVSDIGADAHSIGFPPHHPPMHSFLGVPIMTVTQRYGAFYFTDKIGAVEFTEQDEKIAGALTAQIGVAYENALRYDAIQREIAERRQAEAALRESEERYHSLFQNIPIGLYRTALDGTILDANPALVQMLGFPNLEALQQVDVAELYADAEGRDHWLAFMAQKGVVRDFEVLLNRYDGRTIWCQINTLAVAASTGQARYFEGSVQDITERKRAEDDLKERQHQLALIYETVGDVIYQLELENDGRYRFISVNPTFLAVTGLHYDQVVGKRVDEVIRQPSLTQVLERYSEAIREKKIVRWEETSDYPTGRLTGEVSIAPVFDETGKCTHLIGSVHDITERKQAQTELTALHNALAVLFTSSNLLDLGQQIVAAIVREFHIMDCGLLLVDEQQNQMLRLARAGGYGVETDVPIYLDGPGLVAEAVRSGKMVYVPDVSLDSEYLYVANDTRTQSELVVPFRTTGEVIGVLDLQSPKKDAFSEQDRRILSAFAERAAWAVQTMLLNEQLQQHAAELEWRVAERTAQLDRTREYAEIILNNSNDAITVIGEDETIRNTNPAFNDLFGYEPDDVFKQPFSDMFDHEQASQIHESLMAVAAGQQSVRLELIARRSDGRNFHADSLFSPIKQDADKITGVVCSLRDITMRRQMEEDLRVALAKEKELNDLKSRFVSMVSHEFRTPLTVITTSVELLRNYSERLSAERKQEHLVKIIKQIRLMTNLLNDVLTLGKAESVGMEFNPQPTNLEECCRIFVEEVQHSLDSTHQVVVATNQMCTKAFADEKLLRHIVSNLLTNAIKYSPGKERVYLDLQCEHGQATIRVRDEGIGIPEEDQQRMYEAFHRAKNVGTISGTGLGLSIIRSAVEAHRGTVSFASQMGVGTTFTVLIPINQPDEG
ncbi:MAG: PAS domain S-box protein [Chloroflexi bacterium]|nr:PAS domain S-box protein [Chloroflexota bacterium]